MIHIYVPEIAFGLNHPIANLEETPCATVTHVSISVSSTSYHYLLVYTFVSIYLDCLSVINITNNAHIANHLNNSSKSVPLEKVKHDSISSCCVVVKRRSMSGIWLNVDLEVL